MGKSNTRRLIYVHGANGSGKSTLARVLITCAGGIVRTQAAPTGAQVSETRAGLCLVGAYRTATGGADSVQPYALVPKTAHWLLSKKRNVFLEGLMTPGVETCRKIAHGAKKLNAECAFVLIEEPIMWCTHNVIQRRQRKGNFDNYDNDLLVKKHYSARSWAQNLLNAGLLVQILGWTHARDFCLKAFALDARGAVGLLDTGTGKDS